MSILTTKELLDFLDSQFKFIDGEISHNKFKNELLQASKDITINAMIIELNKAKVNSKENALIVFQQKTIAYVIAKITEEDIFNVQSPLAYDYISELFKSYESELLKSGTILVPHKPVPTLKDMSINYKNIKRDLLKDLKLNRSSTNLKKFKLIDTTSSGDGTRYEARWKDSEIK
ncbi:MAG: hypothetical protein U9Q40_02625, partial [Campylobacterota bacterium]|nr:hypothetical protein [Campylobacterota bacterium]